MNIVIYANCQGAALKFYMQNKIKGKYTVLSSYTYFKKPHKLPKKILHKADIFIFQFVNKQHGICSTDPNSENNIFTLLNKHCIKIGFPTIFQSALWPIIPGFGSCIDGHNIIKNLKMKNKSLDDIMKMYDDNEIIFEMNSRYERCEKHTSDIENYYFTQTELDIVPVTKFIKDNYKHYDLFYTHCHPTSYVFIYITNQIIKMLNKFNMDFKEYNNIFNHDKSEGVINSDKWPKSKYTNSELNCNIPFAQMNETIYKKTIATIYNSP